jgi:hypothetical protein
MKSPRDLNQQNRIPKMNEKVTTPTISTMTHGFSRYDKSWLVRFWSSLPTGGVFLLKKLLMSGKLAPPLPSIASHAENPITNQRPMSKGLNKSFIVRSQAFPDATKADGVFIMINKISYLALLVEWRSVAFQTHVILFLEWGQ